MHLAFFQKSSCLLGLDYGKKLNSGSQDAAAPSVVVSSAAAARKDAGLTSRRYENSVRSTHVGRHGCGIPFGDPS
jgi:hypothetical protein